jgi:hypothetical protein
LKKQDSSSVSVVRRAFSAYSEGRLGLVLRKKLNHFLSQDAPDSVQKFVKGREERRIARSPFYKLHPYPGELSYKALDAHTVVDLDLGILFHRIPKCANSSLAASVAQLKQVAELPSDQGFKRDVRQQFAKPSMLTREQAEKVLGLTKFVFVRNPYARLLSAYLSKVVPAWGQKKIRDVIKPGAAAMAPVAPFEEFCRALEAGALRKNVHWRPQTDFLTFPAPTYDFIGRVENLDADFRKVALLISKDPKFAVMSEDTGHRTGADDLLAKYYTTDLFDRVHRLYRNDFETFGYSKAAP